MTGPIFMAIAWTARPILGFLPSHAPRSTVVRCFSAPSSDTTVSLEHCLSRLSTLQTLLSKHGAPGSSQCGKADDLQAITANPWETPELVASLSGAQQEHRDLHPYLLPIAKSKSTEAYICAYRNPFVEESDKKHPWPIVEAKLNSPGMRLVALNSEHLMRRMACEADVSDNGEHILAIYNDGLGRGILPDPALDAPYESGSVEQLGYGVDKYVLLRVGPFADLYQSMAQQHAAKGDEQSSLISAEASSSKLAGFGSNLLYYSKLLSSFPNRQDEARDAARMCLRLPLPTIGMTMEDFKDVAVLSLVAEESDSVDEALAQLRVLYDKMREVESGDSSTDGMTEEQMAIDEANLILDDAVLSKASWGSVRKQVAEKFRSVGRDDFANFVDL